MRKTAATLAIGFLAMGAVGLAGCKKSNKRVGAGDTSGEKTVESGSSAGAGEDIDLQAAGATFPYPLYSKWVSEYQKVDPHVRINYQAIGSGGGIRQITEKTVDFGASDAPMTDEMLAKAPGKLVHIPTTLGAVVVDLQPARLAQAQARRLRHGGHLPRHHQEVERQEDRRAQPGRQAAVARHLGRAPLGRKRHQRGLH